MEHHQAGCHYHQNGNTVESLSSSSKNQSSAGSSNNAGESASSNANMHRTTFPLKRKRGEHSHWTELQLPTVVQTSNAELRVSKLSKHSCSTPQKTVSKVHPQSVVPRQLSWLQESNAVLEEADRQQQESDVLFPNEVGSDSSNPMNEPANDNGDDAVRTAPSDAGPSMQDTQHSIETISESVRQSSENAALMLNKHCRLSPQAAWLGVLGLRKHVRVKPVLKHWWSNLFKCKTSVSLSGDASV